MTNIAVFISGRGSNFMSLHKKIKDGYIKDGKICVVFSNNPDAKGLEYAREECIPTLVIPYEKGKNREEYDSAILAGIKQYNPCLICLAGYMLIVTRAITLPFKNRIMNIHPALLPAFKGLHAQKQALDYGSRFSGCTVHFVDDGLDSGPIILQAVVPVQYNDTEETLSNRILEQEHIIYPEAVKLFTENKLKINGRCVEIAI